MTRTLTITFTVLALAGCTKPSQETWTYAGDSKVPTAQGRPISQMEMTVALYNRVKNLDAHLEMFLARQEYLRTENLKYQTCETDCQTRYPFTDDETSKRWTNQRRDCFEACEKSKSPEIPGNC